MTELYALVETAAGYVLGHVKEWEQIASDTPSVQACMTESSKFMQALVLKAFHPFSGAEEALQNMNAIVAGEVHQVLQDFLEKNMPAKKRKKATLGIAEPALGKALSELGFPVTYDKNVLEVVRGCRLHLRKLIKKLEDTDIAKFQVGLGHSFSRTAIKFDPKRQDKPILQAIALMDSLDKNINLFSMRVREWFGWHFPELAKIVTDNELFVKCVIAVETRDSLENDNPEKIEKLIEILDGNEEIVNELVAASKMSLGQDLAQADTKNIVSFANIVVKLAEERRALAIYLDSRLKAVAPNLQALTGDTLCARLIAHAGALVTLAKYPASTIQILGAEKALFRALKAKSNTPKYGLLFQSSFIGRASTKNKGRISRYLANKCAMAARLDYFCERPDDMSPESAAVYGIKMKEQVEERLKFLVDHKTPRKNTDVMREAMGEFQTDSKKAAKKAKKKRKSEAISEPQDDAPAVADVEMVDGEGSGKKKTKKRKSVEAARV
eukprot:GHVN01009296.1.p1 GENE.GHVN01009296.1~~GHVN01009296.1.p1  ORF type:complete len:497 (+),score=84.90 GHVN01009296.1:47-1537(+)